MNFVWKADNRLKTPEQIAREVHGVSLARHLDELASVMTLMCFKVESDFWCPANKKDPSSFNYPHDSESNDGRSVGYAQQQNGRAGDTLPPGDHDNWWGPMASRMSCKGAADVFQSRLPNDYRRAASNPHLAGEIVANVQQCAPQFRHRYAEEWDACVTLLRRALAQGPVAPVPPRAPVPVPVTVLRPQFEERQMFGSAGSQRSRKPINFFLHTQEGSWDATARDLAAFCQGQNGVSYHYTLRDRVVYDVVDTDLYSWSVLSANVFSVNLCFAGSAASQTRQQWLDRYGPDIEIAAYLAVQDARKYGFSTEVIRPPYSGNARPGIADHKYVTQKLGIGDHTDVGNNFPWDVFAEHVARFATGVGEDDVPLVNQRSGSIYRESNDVLPWAGTPMDFIIDAQTHEGRVEALALRGGPKALALVKAVAAGKSPVNADLTDENRAQAQAILDYIAAD
jgi:N-acetyl-anhydromuramyl-L-alanine amidase AmpD